MFCNDIQYLRLCVIFAEGLPPDSLLFVRVKIGIVLATPRNFHAIVRKVSDERRLAFRQLLALLDDLSEFLLP